MTDLIERAPELATVKRFVRLGGVLSIEAGAGIGKTSLLDAACSIARRDKRLVLRARGSDLERDFAFGIVRRLFERRFATATAEEMDALLAGPGRSVVTFFQRNDSNHAEQDISFAVLHGLYWLTMILADRAPLLLAVDDAHWADNASQRWLAYLAPRLEGPNVSLVVALRPDDPTSQTLPLLAVRDEATTIRPQLLSRAAVAAIFRNTLRCNVDDEEVVSLAHQATGGNPFYLRELLRALERTKGSTVLQSLEKIVRAGGTEEVARQLRVRLQRLHPAAQRLAQALAILGDGCELRHAAAIAHVPVGQGIALATELVRLEVLSSDRPPSFLHPIVRHAVAQTMSAAEQDTAHRAVSRMLHVEHARPEQVAAHLSALRGTGDPWVVERLRAAAQAAVDSGASAAAVDLLDRALDEPPIPAIRVAVLREAAWAHQLAGREGACRRLEEALSLTEEKTARARLSLELAQAHAAFFQWADAVHVLDCALADSPRANRLELQSQLIAIGLQDARTARRAVLELERLSRRKLSGMSAAAVATARGMVAVLTGRPVDEAARPLEAALAMVGPDTECWDLRAALLWSLLTAERFSQVEAALAPLRTKADRAGSSRGLVAVYSTTALLKFKLGDLAQADSAARVALRVVRDGDFSQGLPFVVTVLADVAVVAGQFDEAEALMALLPHEDLAAGVHTLLVPAARGRLRLAQGRPEEALKAFEACLTLWQPNAWGLSVTDVGYTHARAGAAHALLALGDRRRAREVAREELADARRFGGRRALGIALRVTGLAEGGAKGLGMLAESAAVLNESPAVLERAASLLEWGAALRRAGQLVDARRVLAEGLDHAARCGARPLMNRIRDELRIAGARPRRDWSIGVEALTPSELRVARLARDGQSNRQIAQGLYLSVKTIEGHLARAYGKRGIARRKELDRVLGPRNPRVATL